MDSTQHHSISYETSYHLWLFYALYFLTTTQCLRSEDILEMDGFQTSARKKLDKNKGWNHLLAGYKKKLQGHHCHLLKSAHLQHIPTKERSSTAHAY